MLLNEFLKEHRKGQEQEASINQLKSMVSNQAGIIAQQRAHFEKTTAQQHRQIDALTASVKEQTAHIQQVSAQIEMSKFATGRIRRGGPTTKVVRNNP